MKKIGSWLSNHPQIKSWFRDSDGYWIMLHEGWQSDGCHSIHGETLHEVRTDLRSLRRCDVMCSSCSHDRKFKEEKR